ncbi:hypothetical protein OBRU01_20465 [Operophtera brumata]|uniref:Uncharacterized protein n=1 Tax=Operophtera brumata TaxID=104452 RepID=A0A0L7KUP2_OPEBR|nr:hypothetical protein OBRU01_20465 [Operophtera brumata]
MTCKTACEMWCKLNAIFETVVEEIVNRLRVQKEELPEKLVMAKILLSLADTYYHFLSAWESVTPEKKTL